MSPYSPLPLREDVARARLAPITSGQEPLLKRAAKSAGPSGSGSSTPCIDASSRGVTNAARNSGRQCVVANSHRACWLAATEQSKQITAFTAAPVGVMPGTVAQRASSSGSVLSMAHAALNQMQIEKARIRKAVQMVMRCVNIANEIAHPVVVM